MKHKKTILIIIYLVIVSILFIACSNFWYNATEELYEYNSFKESLVEDMKENPDFYKKEFNVENEEQLTPEVIDEIYNKSISKRYAFIASASLPISIIGGLIIISPILIIISTVKKYHKYRLSIDDFKKNSGYYRALLKNYNPLELSYNNNYNLDDNALIAMILFLEKKKALKLTDDKILINEENTNNLTELEKDFIDCIKNNKGVIEISHSSITYLTDTSCKKKKLLTMGSIPKKKLIIDIIKAVSFYIILSILWKNLNSIFDMLPATDNTFIVFTLFGIIFALFLFVIAYPIIIIMRYSLLDVFTRDKHAKRTELGNEVNYKLDGLKNFIRDFSSLDERTKEEIILWDDYLIYSVIFGDNKKIYNEMKDKVKYTI